MQRRAMPDTERHRAATSLGTGPFVILQTV